MPFETFSLSALEIAPENPRKSVPEGHIERLAGNISEFGLKQNLVGYHENKKAYITAGGCRLLALQMIDTEIGIRSVPGLDIGIPVKIEDRDQAVASALSENVVRADMGPVERFRAYARLHSDGYSSEQIIRAFGITKRAFDNTMKLANLPEPILEALAAGEMGVDHAGAFAMAPPDEALRVFEAVKQSGHRFGNDWGSERPCDIVRALTTEKVASTDRRAVFVGRAAYERCDGTITEDLFGEDQWFDDPQLLNDMALEKLAKEAKKLRKTWAWAEAMVEAPNYESLRAWGRCYPECVTTLSEAEIRQYDELNELANSEAASEAQIATLNKLEKQVNIDQWSDAQREIAGAIVTIGYGGKLSIIAGLIRSDDVDRAIEAGVMQPDRHMPEPAKADKDPLEYSAALTEDLTVAIHRAAMQCEMLEKPDKLLEILSANLRSVFGCQRMDMSHYPTTRISEALIEQGFTPDPRLVEAWEGNVAKGGKGKDKRDRTITAAIACRLQHHRDYEPKIRKWWTPTAAFFKRLNKAQLIEVVCDIQAGPLRTWDKMKKGQIVDFLDTVFAGTASIESGAAYGSPNNDCEEILATAIKLAKDWLPPVLRPAEVDLEEAA